MSVHRYLAAASCHLGRADRCTNPKIPGPDRTFFGHVGAQRQLGWLYSLAATETVPSQPRWNFTNADPVLAAYLGLPTAMLDGGRRPQHEHKMMNDQNRGLADYWQQAARHNSCRKIQAVRRGIVTRRSAAAAAVAAARKWCKAFWEVQNLVFILRGY